MYIIDITFFKADIEITGIKAITDITDTIVITGIVRTEAITQYSQERCHYRINMTVVENIMDQCPS